MPTLADNKSPNTGVNISTQTELTLLDHTCLMPDGLNITNATDWDNDYQPHYRTINLIDNPLVYLRTYVQNNSHT